MDREEEIRVIGPTIELPQPQPQPQQQPGMEDGLQLAVVSKEMDPPPHDKVLDNKVEIVNIFIDGCKEGVQLIVVDDPTRETKGEFVVLSASYIERSEEEVLLDDAPPARRNYITAPAVDVLGLMGQILVEKKKDPTCNPEVFLHASKKDQLASILSSLPLVYFLNGWPQQLALNITQHLSSVISILIERCKTKLGVEVVPGKLDETIDKITSLDDKLVEKFAHEFSRDVRHPKLNHNDMTLDASMNVTDSNFGKSQVVSEEMKNAAFDVSSLEDEKDSKELIPNNNELNTGDVMPEQQPSKPSIPEEPILDESIINPLEASGNIGPSTTDEIQKPIQDNLEVPSDLKVESNYIPLHDPLVMPTQVTQESVAAARKIDQGYNAESSVVDTEKQTLGPVMDQFSKKENVPKDYKQSPISQDTMINPGSNLEVDSSKAFVQPNSTVAPSQVPDDISRTTVINPSYTKPNDTPQLDNTPANVSSSDKNAGSNIQEYGEKLGIWNNDSIKFDEKVADSDLNKNLPIK